MCTEFKNWPDKKFVQSYGGFDSKTISVENNFNNIRDKRDSTEEQLKAASEALENLTGGDQANLRSSFYNKYRS